MIGGSPTMKGALKCWHFRKFSLLALSSSGRSSGLSRFSTRRMLGTRIQTSRLSSRVSLLLRGLSSASLVASFVSVSLLFSLCFPAPARADLAIALTAWETFWAAMRGADLVSGTFRTANAAEDLQALSSRISAIDLTRGEAQYIAKELEKISGYNIDQDSVMGTVHGVTGNSSYDSEQQCPDCMGGYNYVDGQQVTCDTCGGDGTVIWSTIPYTASRQCAGALSGWINYLTATQTDWSNGGTSGTTSGGYVEIPLSSGAITCPASDRNFINSTSSFKFSVSNASFDGRNVTTLGGSSYFSEWVSHNNYAANARCYLPQSVYGLISELAGDGYDLVLDAMNNRLYFGSGFSVERFNVTSSNVQWVVRCSSFNYYSLSRNMYCDSSGLYFVFGDEIGNVGSVFTRADLGYHNFMNDGEGVPVVDAGGSSDAGVTWGTDTDWYTDTSEGGAAGDTYVTNEGDTIYNSETNTYTTNNNIDVEPITQRLDVLNAINAQIGIDLRTLDASMFKELNDLEWWLQKIYYNLSTLNNTLEFIRSDMANLDRSTNDLVDLSTLESGVSGLSSDFDALLSAIVGSHGADALGIYGRLDTILNWLDDYSPVDLSNIEQTLASWPDYPTFDDSGLLNAITGSHGSDLLGLFGRLDNVLSWLDSYVASDLSVLNHQIGDLVESDGQTPTLHGLIYSVDARLEDINGVVSDIYALGTVTVNGTTYGIADLCYNTWLDIQRLVGLSSVTAGGNTYSFADLLYNIWLDLGQHCDDFVSFWSQALARLDGIIDAIEDLPHSGSNPWRSTPVVDPEDPTAIVPVGPTTLTPYGYPELPDWDTYREPLNIPALEHAVDELMQKFPFSMLNTIVQVAMFIERPAVAPQFDIPAPNPSDWSQPYLVHVDLSDYDQVAATLRLGIVVWAIVRISNRTIKMWVGDKAVD